MSRSKKLYVSEFLKRYHYIDVEIEINTRNATYVYNTKEGVDEIFKNEQVKIWFTIDDKIIIYTY